MSMNSFRFISSMVVIAITFYILCKLKCVEKKKNRILVWYLLAVSYILIGRVDIRFLISIVGATVVTYAIPVLFQKKFLGMTKGWIVIGVSADLLFLGVCKYFQFFYNQIMEFFGMEMASFNIFLPLGISYYTFSSISYMVDVYRKKYEPNKSFSEVALFVAFFPKVVSGPIVRANEFFSQLCRVGKSNLRNLEIGIQIFAWGLFKKMVLADHLGVFVDQVFYSPKAYHSFTVFWAMISYILQLYFDFSGYTDMAIAIGKIFGFDFSWNFNFPFLAQNLSEYWKRWHISLSAWLQEYLYYPLGGNRKGKLRTYFNLFLTMLLGGLWHGAAWTYIVWGALQGIVLCFDKLLLKVRKNKKSNLFVKCLSAGATTLFFAFGLVIFRAESMKNLKDFMSQMLIPHNGVFFPFLWTFVAIFCVLIATIVMWKKRKCALPMPQQVEDRYYLQDLSTIRGLTFFFVLCGMTIGMAYLGNTVFIYGAF